MPRTTPEYFYYVPLIPTLEHLLCQPDIKRYVDTPEQIYDHQHIYNNWTDGAVFKQLALRHNHTSIALVLYYDEVELCDVLGSSSHKMGMVYFFIANLPPHINSKLSSIHLVAIVESDLKKQYGIDKVLEPFLQDLQRLQNGHQFSAGTYSVFLLACIGDTPAAAEMVGYKEGVGGAYRICRTCLADKDTFMNHYCESDFILRTLEDHKFRCNEMENTDDLFIKTHLSREYGINRRSILVNHPSFDVTIMVPQDVMHVILEGVAHHVLYHSFKSLMETHNGFIAQVNKQLKKFPYDDSDKDTKPAEIHISNDKTKFRQKASQMKTLLKVITIVLRNIITDENIHRNFINRFIEIIHIVFSPIISLGTVVILREKIATHLQQFNELYRSEPNTASFIPKQHYLTHLPRQILLFGPLNRQSCMRPEGKHKFFKRTAEKGNYINLSKSLAIAHQKWDSSQNGKRNIRCEQKIIIGKKITIAADHCIYQDILQYYNIHREDVESLTACKHITYRGIKYKVNSTVVVDVNGVLPVIASIKSLYVVNKSLIFFSVSKYQTVGYDDGCCAYKIEHIDGPEQTSLYQYNELVDHHTMTIVKSVSQMHVVLDYDLSDVVAAKQVIYCNDSDIA